MQEPLAADIAKYSHNIWIKVVEEILMFREVHVYTDRIFDAQHGHILMLSQLRPFSHTAIQSSWTVLSFLHAVLTLLPCVR